MGPFKMVIVAGMVSYFLVWYDTKLGMQQYLFYFSGLVEIIKNGHRRWNEYVSLLYLFIYFF